MCYSSSTMHWPHTVVRRQRRPAVASHILTKKLAKRSRANKNGADTLVSLACGHCANNSLLTRSADTLAVTTAPTSVLDALSTTTTCDDSVKKSLGRRTGVQATTHRSINHTENERISATKSAEKPRSTHADTLKLMPNCCGRDRLCATIAWGVVTALCAGVVVFISFHLARSLERRW